MHGIQARACIACSLSLSLSLSFFLSFFLSLSVSLSFFLSLVCAHMHKHTYTYTHSSSSSSSSSSSLVPPLQKGSKQSAGPFCPEQALDGGSMGQERESNSPMMSRSSRGREPLPPRRLSPPEPMATLSPMSLSRALCPAALSSQ